MKCADVALYRAKELGRNKLIYYTAEMNAESRRQLALETFRHIHRLSMRYHITRKTGGLSRIIERGVKGVDFLLRFLLFSVGPLLLELALVENIQRADLNPLDAVAECRNDPR